MNLQEWCEECGVKAEHCKRLDESPLVYVILPLPCPDWYKLWHLDDYVVSARCGVVVWLVPKVKNVDPKCA